MLNHILNSDADAVLSALGAENLPEAEKAAIMEQMLGHFSNIILDTAAAELNDEQIKEFQAALGRPGAEEAIAKITAHVPGLYQKIESAVEQEFFALRAAKNNLT